MNEHIAKMIFEVQGKIEELTKDIATANTDFCCSTCLNTIDKLLDIYEMLSNVDARQDLKNEVNDILERDLF